MNPMKKMINLNDLCTESRSNSRLSTEVSETDSSKIEIKRVKINLKRFLFLKKNNQL